MKLPNSYGSIRKLSGKRRRPYQVVITAGWEVVDGKRKQIQKTLAFTRTREEGLNILAEYNRSPYDIIENPTFAEAYKMLDTRNNSIYIKRTLKTAFGRCEKIHNMKIRDIKKPQLQMVADSITGLSKSSQSEVKYLFSRVFSWAMENDLIAKDYSQFVTYRSEHEPKQKFPFLPEHVEQMCDDMKILCYTGMRISEYLNVKTDDIKDGYIVVRGTKTKAADRIVPIHQKIAEIVNLRLKWAYLTGTDSRVLYDYFYRTVFLPDMERIGIENHTIHDTRRTFATYAHKSQMNPVIVKRILGHKLNDLTEDVYVKKSIDDLKNEMERFKIV